MIVELRWVSSSYRDGPRDVFERVEMPEAPAVGDIVTTLERSGSVEWRMWTPAGADGAPDDAVVQVTVKA